MDGRVQLPVIDWMKRHFSVDYVDMITEPGPDKIVAMGLPGKLDGIKERVSISIVAHKSCAVAVVGHHDCAGNPVPKEEHLDYIKESVDRLVSWDLPVKVVGLWVDERWTVKWVCEGIGSD
jgi:hypothetical protein